MNGSSPPEETPPPALTEPRWPVAFALLAAAGLHFVLPRTLVMGPPWMVLPRRLEVASAMLRSAAVLWVTNVLVFAGWYWRLDAGGPNARDFREEHVRGAFLFPQMVIPGADASMVGTTPHAKETSWRPGFVDYLFLAFNTSTAFSPTDVPVLSRWAKLMMMVQSVISFTAVAVIAARAVNIL
jgi:hypothetical protein